MALGYLLILSIFILIVNILGISLLFLLKNQKLKNILFYFLIIWSILITYINTSSLPTNYLTQQIINWLFGLIPIIAIIVKIKRREKNNIPYILITLSILLGTFQLFF